MLLLVLAAFYPSVHNGLVNWDDDQNIINNLDFRGFGWRQFRWMLTTNLMGVYQPLSWFVLDVQQAAFGVSAAGFHATTVVLHALVTVAFYFLVRSLLRIGFAAKPADDRLMSLAPAVAAALFAVHPLRVEPVAWVSTQPYVLACLFYVLSILAYLRARERKPAWGKWYAASVLFALLAMMSKAIAVSLPAVLLILDVFPLRRLAPRDGFTKGAAIRRVLVEKVPFVALALVTGWLAVWATAENVAMGDLSASDRLASASYGLTFYLYKTLIPTNLLPFYPLPLDLGLTAWPFWLCAVLVVGVTVFVLVIRSSALIAAWATYVVVLLPVLGVAQHGAQIAADRYSYLSCMPWMTVIAAALCLLHRHRLLLRVTVGAVVLITFGLISLTRSQLAVWHDSQSLWSTILTAYPDNIRARIRLGNVFTQAGDYASAVEHYNIALRDDPQSWEAWSAMGMAHARQRHVEQAIECFEKSVALNPLYAEGVNNLGNLVSMRGDYQRAIEFYRRAVDIKPDYSGAMFNLAGVYAALGRLDEAVTCYRRAIEIKPIDPLIRIKLGTILAATKRYGEAIDVLREGLAYTDNPSLRIDLAWLLSTAPDAQDRDPQEALRLISGLEDSSWRSLDVAASVAAANGDFDQAIKYAQQAIEQAKASGNQSAIPPLESRLQSYRNHRQHFLTPG